jgi:pilus assembly protein CpaF
MGALMDRQLISDLRLTVGDRLQEWVAQHQREGAPKSREDQRHYAGAVARDQLTIVERQRMNQGQSPLPPESFNAIVLEVISALFGVGGLQAILDRPDVANVFVHGTSAIAETTSGLVLHCGEIANSEAELVESVQQLLNAQSRTSRQFNSGHPTVSAQLSSGLRLTATMEVSDKVSLAIRRPTIAHVTLSRLVELGTITDQASEFCRALVQGEFNLVISGGTNSGKTTFVRALADEIGPDERLVVVEDAAELCLFDPIRHPNVVSLEAREANIEGVGEVSLGALAKLALRMSPKRVIVGECRGGDEVVAMLSAMTQGNDGSMCTLHAESAEGALLRLRMYLGFSHGTPGDIAADMIGQAVDFVFHLARRRRDQRRVITSIREVTGSERNVVSSNEVFALDSSGILRPTGVLSDQAREILADTGYDTRKLLAGAIR